MSESKKIHNITYKFYVDRIFFLLQLEVNIRKKVHNIPRFNSKEVYINLTLLSALIFAQESHGLSSGRIRTKTFIFISCFSIDSSSDRKKFVSHIFGDILVTLFQYVT